MDRFLKNPSEKRHVNKSSTRTRFPTLIPVCDLGTLYTRYEFLLAVNTKVCRRIGGFRENPPGKVTWSCSDHTRRPMLISVGEIGMPYRGFYWLSIVEFVTERPFVEKIYFEKVTWPGFSRIRRPMLISLGDSSKPLMLPSKDRRFSGKYPWKKSFVSNGWCFRLSRSCDVALVHVIR
jgi:hypothetical protein